MKINKIKLKNNLLIKLKLAEICSQNFYLNKNFVDLVIRLKRALKIIYKYHINNKRIMFIGMSDLISKKFKILLKKSRHTFLPESFWRYGILTNSFVSFFKSKKSKLFKKKFLKLKKVKKMHLVVVLDSFYKNTIAKECYKTRTPVIFLNSLSVRPKFVDNYMLPANFSFSNKKIGSAFFYSMLFSLLKKREIYVSTLKKKKKLLYLKNLKKKNYNFNVGKNFKHAIRKNYTFKKKKT